MANEYIFTSESVSEGHPDKMSDQVSDAVLDAILAEDKYARVACETVFKTGMVMIAGEITTNAKPDYEKIIRETIKDIGYTSSEMGFDFKNINSLTLPSRGHRHPMASACSIQSSTSKSWTKKSEN